MLTAAQLGAMDPDARARLFTETAEACYPGKPWNIIAAQLCLAPSSVHRWKKAEGDPSLAILYMLEHMRAEEAGAIVAQLGGALSRAAAFTQEETI